MNSYSSRQHRNRARNDKQNKCYGYKDKIEEEIKSHQNGQTKKQK